METETNKLQAKSVKRKSTVLHEKQTFWQIIFPMILFFLIIVFVCVLVVMNSGTNAIQNRHFANIATMYLFIPPLLISLPIIAVLIGLIYLVSKIFPYITIYSALIQEKMALVRDMIKQGMDAVSLPFIRVPAYSSSLKTFFNELYKGLRRLTRYE
jgi:ABC-type sugar transport system permease subunit